MLGKDSIPGLWNYVNQDQSVDAQRNYYAEFFDEKQGKTARAAKAAQIAAAGEIAPVDKKRVG